MVKDCQREFFTDTVKFRHVEETYLRKLVMTVLGACAYCCHFLSQSNFDKQTLTLTLTRGELLQADDSLLALDVVFTNESGHDANIIIPWDMRSYGQIFQVAEYRRDGMKWQYHKTLNFITDSTSQVSIWNLDIGKSYRQTLIVKRDTAIDCAYQVIYDPSHCKMFEYVFAYTDSSGALLGNYTHVAEILEWQGPLQSNLLSPTALNKKRVESKLSDLIYERKWKKVKRHINHGEYMPKGWPVINDQLYSQGVLSCLPTFSHHSFLVETTDGIQYITLTYQLGKIYRTRSRITSLMRCMGIKFLRWKLSDERAVKLIDLTVDSYQAIAK